MSRDHEKHSAFNGAIPAVLAERATEVVPRPQRRRVTATHKLRMLLRSFPSPGICHAA
jgi:hypothetical protein